MFYDRIHADIKKHNIQYGFLTGDIVYRSTAEEWDAIDEDIESLGVPVHMAPGNHDVASKLFERRYAVNGKTYYKFSIRGDLFIILDPNIDSWNISGDQLLFLNDAIKSVSKSGQFERTGFY